MQQNTENMNNNYILTALILCAILPAFGQKSKKEKVDYKYIQLPMEPLPTEIKNYASSIVVGYAEEEAEKAKQYEEEKKKAAEEFAKEKEEYKNKSVGKKLLEKALLDEGKPREDFVAKPTFKPTYNTEAIANTYLKLEGYEKGTDNALAYEVTLSGLQATDPLMKNSSSKTKEGVTKYQYWYEVVYTYPMAVRLAVGEEEILNETFEQFEVDKTYKTKKYSSSSALRKALSPNNVMRAVDNLAMKENLTFINKQINEKYAFMNKKRNTVVYVAKGKKHDYTNLVKAYISVEQGLVDYNADAENEKIKAAIEIWNEELKAVDLEDKKAKISRDVAFGLYLNLIEYNTLVRDFKAAKSAINAILLMNPSNAESRKLTPYQDFFEDMRDRYEANFES